jgi:hypothetical protein
VTVFRINPKRTMILIQRCSSNLEIQPGCLCLRTNTNLSGYRGKYVDDYLLRSARNRGKYVDDYLLRSARKRPLLSSDGPGTGNAMRGQFQLKLSLKTIYLSRGATNCCKRSGPGPRLELPRQSHPVQRPWPIPGHPSWGP